MERRGRKLDNLEAIDWAEAGVMGDVRNQGMCGSCHAFTAVATLQGTTAARTGMLFDLSTQQMVDCTRFSPENSSNLG